MTSPLARQGEFLLHLFNFFRSNRRFIYLPRGTGPAPSHGGSTDQLKNANGIKAPATTGAVIIRYVTSRGRVRSDSGHRWVDGSISHSRRGTSRPRSSCALVRLVHLSCLGASCLRVPRVPGCLVPGVVCLVPSCASCARARVFAVVAWCASCLRAPRAPGCLVCSCRRGGHGVPMAVLWPPGPMPWVGGIITLVLQSPGSTLRFWLRKIPAPLLGPRVHSSGGALLQISGNFRRPIRGASTHLRSGACAHRSRSSPSSSSHRVRLTLRRYT
jgi:hypothetical protein